MPERKGELFDSKMGALEGHCTWKLELDDAKTSCVYADLESREAPVNASTRSQQKPSLSVAPSQA
jgi:hypothetical protein